MMDLVCMGDNENILIAMGMKMKNKGIMATTMRAR